MLPDFFFAFSRCLESSRPCRMWRILGYALLIDLMGAGNLSIQHCVSLRRRFFYKQLTRNFLAINGASYVNNFSEVLKLVC